MSQRRRRHTPEQIVRKLREGEKLLGQGTELPEVLKHLEIIEATWYRWRNQYGGMTADDVKRLKELERENARLKKLVAEQAMDIDMLKEVHRGNWSAPTASAALSRCCGNGSGCLNGVPVWWSASTARPSGCHYDNRPRWRP